MSDENPIQWLANVLQVSCEEAKLQAMLSLGFTREEAKAFLASRSTKTNKED